MSPVTGDIAMDPGVLERRLRAIQVDLADEPPESRQAFIEREIRHVLEDLSPGTRPEFLKLLRERFPAAAAAPRGVAPVPAAPAAPAPLPADPRDLVDLLCERAAELPAGMRRELGEQLAAAGLVPAPAPAPEAAPSAPVSSSGGRLPGDIAGDIVSFIAKVDQVAHGTWSVLDPNGSRTGSSGNGDSRADGGGRSLSKVLDGVADGSGKFDAREVRDALNHLQRLVAALIAAISPAARNFAREHSRRFSPAEIEAIVRMRKNMFVDAACWQKYSELAHDDMTEDRLEQEIIQQVARYVTRVLHV